ncbi:hypothetical protein QR680_013233 [Steinernema hermaphroditum]|uniref:Uncharacterized protein n=1 Tax=Steinernema hermaphroditum TaxID=289476 RepID=A0AA39I4T6_9BILA|nr:hypothetical protein QR680_013233 [Steinernema hermaphroditum]
MPRHPRRMRFWMLLFLLTLFLPATLCAPHQELERFSQNNVLEKIIAEMEKIPMREDLLPRNRRRLFEPLRNRNVTIIARCYFNPISC